MPPPNILDSVYGKAASLGRDVFQYIMTGAMFAIVGSVPWWSTGLSLWKELQESGQITLLLVAATVLFGLGHVLLTIGFWIRNKIIRSGESWWSCVFCCRAQVEEYHCYIKSARDALPSGLVVGHERCRNVHVGLEMSVLRKQPELHAAFVERYSTLWHLRLGLAASFLVAGVINVINVLFAICSLDITTCCRDQLLAVLAGIVGAVSVLLGWLLMRQHLVTNTNFLHRVIVAFKLSEQKNG